MRNPITARGVVLALLLALAAPMLAACNTTAGAGQDVSAAGHAVTNERQQRQPGFVNQSRDRLARADLASAPRHPGGTSWISTSATSSGCCATASTG